MSCKQRDLGARGGDLAGKLGEREARAFLEKKLTAVWADFVGEAWRAGTLRRCRPLPYEGGSIANYSDPLTLDWYLLRYLPAYLAEYWLMYTAVLRSGLLASPLRVASIGCGCGVDLWALELALARDESSTDGAPCYAGFDRVEWPHCEGMDGRGRRINSPRDVLTLKSLGGPYNVLTFGKSLSEFSRADVPRLGAILRRTSFSGDCVALLLSTTPTKTASDEARLGELAGALTRAHGYRVMDERTSVFPSEAPCRPLGDLCRWVYPYPEGIYERLQELCTLCVHVGGGAGTCGGCEIIDRETWYPITTAQYIRYKILFLERVGRSQP